MAELVFMDGFDTSYSSQKYMVPATVAAGISTTTPRSGSKCLRNAEARILQPLERTYFWLGCGYMNTNVAGLTAGGTEFISAYRLTGQALWKTYIDNAGRIGFRDYDNGTITWSAPGVIVSNTWHYVEIYTKLDTTVAGAVLIKVDGVGAINEPARRTTNGGSTGHVRLLNAAGGGGVSSYDDVYVATSAANDFSLLGSVTVRPYALDGAGDHSAWTPSAGTALDCVNDDPYDDADYIESDTVGAKHSFAVENPTTMPNGTTVHAVGVFTRMGKNDDLATRTARALLRNGTTDSPGTTRALTTAVQQYQDYFLTNPDGGGAWDKAALNTIQAGVEVVS